MRHSLTILISVLLTSLCSCSRFERKFYSRIDQGQINYIKTGRPDTFDLSTITDFNWDSVLYVSGNESVPVPAWRIEEQLGRKTNDLPTYMDRFYFLLPDKTIIEKEMKSALYHNPAGAIWFCRIDSSNCRHWLARNECVFLMVSNSEKIGEGTVSLSPACNSRGNYDDSIYCY